MSYVNGRNAYACASACAPTCFGGVGTISSRLRCCAIPRRLLTYLSVDTVIYTPTGKRRIQLPDSVKGANSVFNELDSSQGRRCFVWLIMYVQTYKLPGTMIYYI